MVRTFLWCGVCAGIAMGALVHPQRPVIAGEIEPRQIERPATNDEVLPSGARAQPGFAGGQPALAAIEAWLALHFDLPSVDRHPRIELAPPAKIAALRYQGFFSNPRIENAPSGDAGTASRSDVVAVYSDATQTIYLPEGWTGTTAAELSVLVHEMVHHVQNVGGLKYQCPQEREKLAYMAQDRWLGLFGHNLEADFELDAFSLLVKTRCLY
jgi:Domain of unknown function (DUF6647)